MANLNNQYKQTNVCADATTHESLPTYTIPYLPSYFDGTPCDTFEEGSGARARAKFGIDTEFLDRKSQVPTVIDRPGSQAKPGSGATRYIVLLMDINHKNKLDVTT